MTFWVDGDSCPRPAMEILLKYARKENLTIVVAADRILAGVKEAGAQMRLIESGSDSVDDCIAAEAAPGDLALTRDFGLALRLMQKGVNVLNDKGKKWELKELRSRARDAEIMRAMRGGGMVKKQPRSYAKSDAEAFAASLKLLLDIG